ncbi:MAG: AAA family ATPase [Halobacteriaceae archaeon]
MTEHDPDAAPSAPGDGDAASDGGDAPIGDGAATAGDASTGDGVSAGDADERVATDGASAQTTGDGARTGDPAPDDGSETAEGAGDGTNPASPETAAATVEDAGALAESLVENIERVIVGKHHVVEHLVTAVLGRGHVLLDDVPGVGKTMLARSVARSVGGDFRRIQFTPDLLPTDVTGVNVYDEGSQSFEFRPGPIFANVVLGDEINRAPPKTQSALLEAMEEAQVTVDGETRSVPDPFVVIATQNAVERERTYELPVAEVDRFAKRLGLGYPDLAEEEEVLKRVAGGHPIESVEPVATVADLRAARATARDVTVEAPVRSYVARLAQYTRENAALGVSPRGSIALLRAAQARAIFDRRGYVVPQDVRTEAPAVLAHRVRVEPGGAVGDQDAAALVDEALTRVDPER